MAFSFIQSSDTYSNGNLTLNGVGSGNLLVVFVSAGATLSSLTVSGGGTWVALTEYKHTVYSTYTKLYYCLSATGGNSTFSLSANPTDVGWGVLEFSKSGSANYQTISNASISSPSTSFTSGNISVTNDNSLMVSCLADEYITNTVTWDANWVEKEENTSHCHSCAYRIISTSGTYTASGTIGASSESMVVSTLIFYESGAAASVVPVFMNQYRQRS